MKSYPQTIAGQAKYSEYESILFSLLQRTKKAFPQTKHNTETAEILGFWMIKKILEEKLCEAKKTFRVKWPLPSAKG